jgi:hypothetical protein
MLMVETCSETAVPPNGVPGFDQLNPRRASGPGPALRGQFLTPEDRLFFLITYFKTYVLQVVQGRLFGMAQCKANQWIHVLLTVILAALRAFGDAPASSLTALARRLGVSEAVVATVVAPLEEVPAPLAAAPAVVPASPFCP